MVDGVKIYVSSTVAEKWLNNPYLKFTIDVYYSTGEISKNKLIAKYQGLTFTIFYKDNTHTNIVRLQITGSLHKYWNKGKHNYNNFTFYDLTETIKELENRFYINPNISTIHNLEFGVNVKIPLTVTELLKNLVAFKTFFFKTLSEDKNSIGKQIVAEKHRLKIYDKGKQSRLKNVSDLLRIEMHYNKMHDLKKYNIVAVSDLTELRKVKPLIQEIVNRWDNVIYYDKSINIKHLKNEQERRRIVYSAAPRHWVELGKRQRTRIKKRFNELMSLYGSTTQKDISIIILNKWNELTAEKCPPFTHPKKKIQQTQSVHLLPVSIDGYKVDKTTLKKTINILPKTTPKRGLILLPIITTKKGVCKVCSTDISHKKRGAKYCNKKCNNNHNGKMRTKKRQQKRYAEIKNLEKLILLIDKGKIWIMISYKASDGIYTDTLHQHEIATTSDWVHSVQKVLVTEYRKKAPPIKLTSYRARKLIKLINDKNLRNGKKATL
ncbi:hypothetical protein [Tenacibaculum maritimum]|uniref:hypothetical protein n=2 Tax=Tenacibaculum maritimum TaxID=107401 RepID=UPI0012E524FB|nr:hypothetical protein [Tenacibaculum maritimum]CAA0172515.1 conserved hypothetical protein [Tenacibaculum maritimum]CAA0186135.1 conserved hypothetical protein [Tenacibaculum maritimum]